MRWNVNFFLNKKINTSTTFKEKHGLKQQKKEKKNIRKEQEKLDSFEIDLTK